MGRAIAIEKLTLIALEQQFGLNRTNNADFFCEWQGPLPELTEFEKDRVAHISAIYENFERRSALENTVSLTVVSPLLDAAGLFLPPFYVETERSVEIVAEDGELTVRGDWILSLSKTPFGYSRLSLKELVSH